MVAKKPLPSLYYKPVASEDGVTKFMGYRDTGKAGRYAPIFQEGADLLTLTQWARMNGYQMYRLRGDANAWPGAKSA